MDFIRHRWKMILLMALLTAAILGGAMLFWSSTREKTYTGGLFVKEERQKEVAEAGIKTAGNLFVDSRQRKAFSNKSEV